MRNYFLSIIFLLLSFFGNSQPNTKSDSWITPEISELLDGISLFWKLEIDTISKKIKIPFNFNTNPYSENYYIKYFPSTISQIDTNKHYNKIYLGYLEINFISKDNYTKKFYLNDSIFMNGINSKEVKRRYYSLKPNGKYTSFDWDKKLFLEAYQLLFEIEWLTLVNETFSVVEYLKLKKLLCPAIGAEYGEDFFNTEVLIKLTHQCRNL